MKVETDDYIIDVDEKNASVTVEGTMRLQSPNAYLEPFQGITELLSLNNSVTINITKLNYLNSSGVSSLARLVLNAKSMANALTLICSEDIPWQKKTIFLKRPPLIRYGLSHKI